MVNHEEVDVDLVCTGPPDGLIVRPLVLDQLDAAAVTLLHWRHVPGVGREDEGVPAPGVSGGVAGEAVNLLPS